MFLLFIVTASSCSTSTNSTIDNDPKVATMAINTLLDNWHQAAANADLQTYIGSMDSSASYIGTDATEKWKRDEFKTFCKPYFDKKTTWDFTPLERNVYLNQNKKTAWFDELLKTHMGTCRGSGTLELLNGNWKIMHYVLSMAIPNDDTEAVKAAKKKNDDAFLMTFE